MIKNIDGEENIDTEENDDTKEADIENKDNSERYIEIFESEKTINDCTTIPKKALFSEESKEARVTLSARPILVKNRSERGRVVLTQAEENIMKTFELRQTIATAIRC